MIDLFGSSMAGNYDQRKVAKDLYPWGFISTARVTDGTHPFETAVEHKYYNGGRMVIVEAYDDKETAAQGHAKWIGIMTAKELPKRLVDCSNYMIQQIADGYKPKE